jgi:hypothetical protein
MKFITGQLFFRYGKIIKFITGRLFCRLRRIFMGGVDSDSLPGQFFIFLCVRINLYDLAKAVGLPTPVVGKFAPRHVSGLHCHSLGVMLEFFLGDQQTGLLPRLRILSQLVLIWFRIPIEHVKMPHCLIGVIPIGALQIQIRTNR